MTTCGTCKFFLLNGECHRYPPGPQDFLRVASANWCGEWKAKDDGIEVKQNVEPVPKGRNRWIK